MDFTQPWDYGDITFVIEDRKIFVNKAVLGMSSDAFNAMFTSDFKEKELAEIPLPDKKFDDFLQLMQILHPQANKIVDETNVECILPLAQEYLINHVMKQCEKYLLTQPLSIHNLVLADKFSLSELRKVCIQYIQDIPYDKLNEDPEYELVTKETLCEVFKHKLQLHEGKDPLKDIVCRLMSQPPSIKNLSLAVKYHIPEVSEKCVKYLKDTPLEQLKQEAGFSELKVDTLNEALTHKVGVLTKYESLQSEFSKIASLGNENKQRCTYCGYDKGEGTQCSYCQCYRCESGNLHEKGTNHDCLHCKAYKFDKICEVVKKY